MGSCASIFSKFHSNRNNKDRLPHEQHASKQTISHTSAVEISEVPQAVQSSQRPLQSSGETEIGTVVHSSADDVNMDAEEEIWMTSTNVTDSPAADDKQKENAAKATNTKESLS